MAIDFAVFILTRELTPNISRPVLFRTRYPYSRVDFYERVVVLQSSHLWVIPVCYNSPHSRHITNLNIVVPNLPNDIAIPISTLIFPSHLPTYSPVEQLRSLENGKVGVDDIQIRTLYPGLLYHQWRFPRTTAEALV